MRAVSLGVAESAPKGGAWRLLHARRFGDDARLVYVRSGAM